MPTDDFSFQIVDATAIIATRRLSDARRVLKRAAGLAPNNFENEDGVIWDAVNLVDQSGQAIAVLPAPDDEGVWVDTAVRNGQVVADGRPIPFRTSVVSDHTP